VNAAVGGPSTSNTTFTTSTTTSTNVTNTNINVSVTNYETRVLGLSSFSTNVRRHEAWEYQNKVVYNNVFSSPASSNEVQAAFDEARAAIRADLSIASRGQIHWEGPTLIQSNSTQYTDTAPPVETSRTSTQTISTTETIGPATILIGDNQSQTFFVAAGSVNYNTNVHTHHEVTTTTTVTTTTNQQETYAVHGSICESPIVLNMDGSGYLQASAGRWFPHPGEFFADRRVLFDFYGNGFPVAMEWVGPADGLLCQPKADGSVDGTCLFGTATGFSSGYEHLASLDMNMDGKLTGKELAGLSVWQDKNGNARAEKSEVRTVQQCEITQLDLKHKQMRSSFVMKGKQCVMFDWWPTMFEVSKVKKPV
jgi:hypothetical protein